MSKSTGFEFDVEMLHELNKVIKFCQSKDCSNEDILLKVLKVASHIEDELLTNNICPECGSILDNITEHDYFEDEDVKLYSCNYCGYMERMED